MKAAIFHGVNQLLTVEEVEVDQPRKREVLVDIAASGVCHSDLHFVEGLYDLEPMFGTGAPAILGHEGAGVVREVGPDVTEFQAGDHVIACPSVFCGKCDFCLTGQTHLCQSLDVRRGPDEDDEEEEDDGPGKFNDDDPQGGGDKVTICHAPPGKPENAHTITVGASAAEAHLAQHDEDHEDSCDP